MHESFRVTLWWGGRGDALPLDIAHRCSHCRSSEHGVPSVADRPDVGVSVTHSGLHSGVAWFEGAAVGLDAEPVDVDVSGIGPVALSGRDEPTDDPAALRRIWVRKEAVLKALGTGLLREPSTFAVSAAEEPAAVTWWDPTLDHPDHVQLVDLTAAHGVPHGQIAAVAVLTDETVSIRRSDASS